MKIEFTAKAQKVKGGQEIGAWTDGIGVFSDSVWPTPGHSLVPGKTYKVIIEEVKEVDK